MESGEEELVHLCLGEVGEKMGKRGMWGFRGVPRWSVGQRTVLDFTHLKIKVLSFIQGLLNFCLVCILVTRIYMSIDPFTLAFLTHFAEMTCFLLLVGVLLQSINLLGSLTAPTLEHEFHKFLIYMHDPL